MKKNACKLIIYLVIIIPAVNCATAPKTVDAKNIRRELLSTKQKIISDRRYLARLKGVKVAKSGFYYIVDTNGIVVFHPQSPLVGRSFKHVPFIQKIIGAGDGCVAYLVNSNEQYILFTRINNREILCLSIAKKQVKGTMLNCDFLE